ncbi:MAG: phage terminase large subunit [Methylobacter sp.]|uniref:phage terminase large subunit n=1 Tax=Methylobacter sp. TaxID=2051955 RepID=UPI0025D96F44|nr:phage terminase large subunit [Methylobacter sp.]MCK9622012.1 phage terminase large subunit [Methylobacter sp.]
MSIVDALRADQSRESFWCFRQYMDPKLKRSWWPREIANELQTFFEDYQAGLRPKLVIQAPPQHGKSTAVIDWLAWVAGKSPDTKIIYASFSDRLGVRANLRIRRIMASEKYKRVFGTRLGGQVTQDYFEYADKTGYFRNTTVRGSVTGESLDIGVIDDPIRGRSDANSETIRSSVWDWFTDDFSTRFADDGALLIILTRWHIDDPVGRLIELDPTVKVLRYPAIAEDDEAHRKADEPLFKEHKSLEFLKSMRARMLPSSWNSLYQQNPTLADGEVFKPDMMQLVDAIPSDCNRYVRAWDLAATSKGDWTVGIKMTRDKYRWYIVDVVRMRGAPHEVEAVILNTAKRDGATCKIRLPQDPGQAGKSQAARFVNMLAGFKAEALPVTGDKETRAGPFAAQVNIGNVSALRGAWIAALIDEMRAFPNGAHDDQVDACADAFNDLTPIGEIEFKAVGSRVINETEQRTHGSIDTIANTNNLKGW